MLGRNMEVTHGYCPPHFCLNDWLQGEGQGIQVLGLDVSAQDSRSVLEILLAQLGGESNLHYISLVTGIVDCM